MSDIKNMSRREFIGTAGAVGLSIGLMNSGFPSIKPNYTPSELIRVGVIGTGSRGCRLIRSFVNTAKNVKITAVCDVLSAHLAAGKELSGASAKEYTDYKKLLEQKDLDCVIIATPPYLHAEMSIAAMDAGKDVFCEKTLAYSIEQCKAIVNKVKETKKIFQVGHQRRYNPVYTRTMEMIKEGVIGKVTTIRSQWHRNGNWRRPCPDPSLERMINWRMYREYSCGLMGELGSHQVDVANWVLGKRPIKVAGFGGINYWKDGRETYDNVHLVYEYPDGVRMLYSSITTNAHFGCSEQIMGDEGTIILTEQGGEFFKEEIARKAPEATAFGTDRTHELQKFILITGATIKPEDPSTQEAKKIAMEKVDPTSIQMLSFFECIRENKEPACNAEVGRDASVAIHMGIRAMRKSEIVYWEPSFT
ncbi:MAG: Gfo/Idh/MocA family oxidoreductase [Candidatus Helarchaeota archaeon]|nr:Gfo/Idh/MocA family oxidoreductase [Candidatus Helarchaeota archaeon]